MVGILGVLSSGIALIWAKTSKIASTKLSPMPPGHRIGGKKSSRERLNLESRPDIIRAVSSDRDIRDQLLNPRLWTLEMDAAWHHALPDVYAAFDALRSFIDERR